LKGSETQDSMISTSFQIPSMMFYITKMM